MLESDTLRVNDWTKGKSEDNTYDMLDMRTLADWP
jgi:hypothetical protein